MESPTQKMTYTVEVTSHVRLLVFYCNECWNPYLTDNAGNRSVICDHCRCEMGMKGRAIEGDE